MLSYSMTVEPDLTAIVDRTKMQDHPFLRPFSRHTEKAAIPANWQPFTRNLRCRRLPGEGNRDILRPSRSARLLPLLLPALVGSSGQKVPHPIQAQPAMGAIKVGTWILRAHIHRSSNLSNHNYPLTPPDKMPRINWR